MSGWISVKDGMPKEHDSVFKRFKGTLYWVEQMFESISDDVNVAVVFEDGKRKTYTAHTADGKWKGLPKIGGLVVTHWMPLPEPPEDEAMECDSCRYQNDCLLAQSDLVKECKCYEPKR